MPETRITNVVVPEIFGPYTMERALAKNTFYQSGIMINNPQLSSLLAGGGATFNLPFWDDLGGDSEVPSETVDATINNITADKQIARRQMRVKSWGSNDMAAALAGEDPYEAIADRVAQFWATQMQKTLVSTALGVLNDNVQNDSSTLVHDISIEDGANAAATNRISGTNTIDAVMQQGDRFDEVVGIAVHSAVYTTLVKADLIDYIRDSEGRILMPSYMGLAVVVDDSLPVVAGGTSGYKYWSFLFKANAFAYGESDARIITTEVERAPRSGMGQDILHTRRQFAIHPIGTAWQESSVAGESPTNAELEMHANWDAVYQTKNIGVMALISNG